MIEPPGDFGRSRIFEVDDGIFVAGKITLIEERSGSMHQTAVFVLGTSRDALAMEARKQGGRAGSVKTFVVIEDANPQS